MYAVWARTGRERWSTGTSGSKFGFAAGNFYSTPAVAFGRVYAGNTDSKVYSFGAQNGDPRLVEVDRRLRLLLARPSRTSPGTKPTVYIGSYDGNLYALDARTGSTRWTAPRRRAHLGRPVGRGARRLLRGPRLQGDLRRGRAHRRARLQAQPRLLQPGGLGRAAPLHDRATRASRRSTR